MGAKIFMYMIIKMDIEKTAVLEQNVEINNQKLVTFM